MSEKVRFLDLSVSGKDAGCVFIMGCDSCNDNDNCENTANPEWGCLAINCGLSDYCHDCTTWCSEGECSALYGIIKCPGTYDQYGRFTPDDSCTNQLTTDYLSNHIIGCDMALCDAETYVSFDCYGDAHDDICSQYGWLCKNHDDMECYGVRDYLISFENGVLIMGRD